MNDNKLVLSERNLRINSQFNNEDTLMSSNYALKLALQTMKERCQKLQKRLTCLEDENLQLRIERHSVPALVKKEPKTELSVLQKELEELNRQKSLLSHHIYMVSMENKNLWERLSKVTEENSIKDNTLLALADSSNKNLLKPEKSLNIIETCQARGGREDSLEEISLKVLNSIKKNKSLTDVENDEEDDNKLGELALRDCEFTLEMEEEEEAGLYEGLMIEVKRVLDRLKSEKILLKQQQEGLKSAIDTVTKYFKEKQSCKNCVILQEELEKEVDKRKSAETAAINNNHEDEILDSNLRPEPNFNIPKSKESAFEDRICPLCTKFYPKSTPFDEFNEHVLSHFVEEPEQDSLMSNYELIT